MSEIPADIRARVRRFCEMHDPSENAVAELVHAERMAERERCIALIDCGCEPGYCQFPHICAKDDIAAIRNQDKP